MCSPGDPVQRGTEVEIGLFDFIPATPQHFPRSLLRVIPEDRTCDDAGIPRHHCHLASGDWRLVDVTGGACGDHKTEPSLPLGKQFAPLAVRLAADILDRINWGQRAPHACAMMALDRLLTLAVRTAETDALRRLVGATYMASFSLSTTILPCRQ